MSDVSKLYNGIGNENLPTTGYYRSRPNVSTWSDKYAQKNRAWLAREQWEDYKSRFQPYEDQLIDGVTGTELLDQRLSQITLNNQKAFNAAGEASDMFRARYGMSQSDAQRTASQNNQSLAMAKSNADAMNQTRTHIHDRNMAIIGGGEARQMAIQ